MNAEAQISGLTSALDASAGLGAVGLSTIDRFQKRSEVLIALGRRAMAAPPWRTLAYDAAALVAETLETSHFGVAELSDDRTTLALRIAATDAGHRDDDLPSANVTCNETTSLAGYALSVGYPLAISNLSVESRFQDWVLRESGITSALAIPLQRGGESFGALMVADSNVREFTQDELHYFESIAHLVTTTIAHERMYELLEKERRFQATVSESAGSLMLVLSPEWQILQGNRAASEVLEFTPDDLRQRAFTTTLLADEERQVFEDALQKVPKAVSPLKVESWAISKSGKRRRIDWTLAGLTDANFQLERILLTGIDVTRQREIETELENARQIAGADAARPFSPIPQGPTGDRRRRNRRSFPYVQLIAPLDEGLRPEEHLFRSVQCRDISPSGFSYRSSTPPESPDLIVALGGQDNTTYLSARVMHATIVERDNEVEYIVGCRYLARQDRSEKLK